MNHPTVPEFLAKAFSAFCRSPSGIFDPEDQCEGLHDFYCPEERHLEVEGAFASGSSLADYFLDRRLSREWEIRLSDRVPSGGILTAMGFLSGSSAAVIVLADDEDAEFQRVSISIPSDSPDESPGEWLDRQKESFVRSELARAAEVVARGSVLLGEERALELFHDALKSSSGAS